MMVGLLDIRNNRNVGHTGGEVDPNYMDATAVLHTAKWLVAELVRLLHTLSIEDATAIVDALTEREVPTVWVHGDKKRVLRTGLSWKKQTLLLLLSETEEASEADLVRWLEHKSVAVYRRDVLNPMHRARLIEYDNETRTVRLLPPGVLMAEGVANAA
jgi:secreted Zn-dependent insulinase-like peptidase